MVSVQRSELPGNRQQETRIGTRPREAAEGRAHCSERQRQIVEIVLALVAERGADAVSAQAIADRIGVTQPAVFRHFPNKEAIWVAVMDWLSDKLREIHSVAERRAHESPLVVLEQMFLEHVRMIRRYPALAKVVLSDHLRLQFPVLQKRFAQIHAAYNERVRGQVERAQRQKLVPASLSAEAAATMFFCMVQGLGFQFAIARRPMRLLAEAERVFAIYLRGLKAQA